MEKSHTSIIDFSFSLTASASSFSLLPILELHGVSRMNFLSSSRFDSESVSTKFRCKLGMNPLKVLVYCHLESVVWDSYENFTTSSVPYKMICNCFGFILFIGVSKSKPNFLPTSRSVCLLNEENLPDHGTMAPSKIDFVLSGMSKSESNSILTPRPWHVLQAPKGELNENVRGSSSPIVIPQ